MARRFRDTRSSKSEMHRMTPNWNWTFNSQKYPVYAKCLLLKPKLWSVSLYDQRFSRYTVTENRKCTKWLQIDLGHLTVKSSLYTLITYPKAQHLVPFALRLSVSERKVVKNRKCTEWPQIELYPVFTKYLLLRPKFWSVSLYDQRFGRYHTFYYSPLTAC